MKTYKLKGTINYGTVYDSFNVEVNEDQIKALIKDNPDLLKPEVKGRYFFPKIREMYWFINSLGITKEGVYNSNVYDDVDQQRIFTGNCYRTKEEAELALKKQRAIVRCWKWQQENAPFEPDWGDEQEEKYYCSFSHESNKLFVDCNQMLQKQFTLPHFKSREDREAFIEANKEDLLLLFTK